MIILRKLFPYVVLCCLVGLLVATCGEAIDKHQQHHELSSADRAAVVASWSR